MMVNGLMIFFKKFCIFCFFLTIFLDMNSIAQENDIFDFDENIENNNILSFVEDFIDLPSGGTSWKVFGETKMNEYPIIDKDGNEWIGVRPSFSEKVKKLDQKIILVQGFMFPLEQDDEQNLFLLGPFPLSCPYHPHTSSNLLIEVHADEPVLFSYEAVNITGKLELVSNDEEYNMFFRLKNAKLVAN